MIGYMIRIVFTYTSKYGNDYINTCSINDLNVGFVYGKATEPLPAKAGRFGVLLKQPKAVSPVKFSFTPIRLSYLKVIGFCFLLQILIFDILLDNFIRHIPAACHKVSPCP